jgi:uncharacterized membrane protein
MNKELVKEISRDLLALGGIPIYFLAMARSLIGEYYIYTYQLLLGLVIITLVSLFVKSNLHLARSLVVLVFSTIFYNDFKFTIFASFIWVLLIGSTLYLKQDKNLILKGIVLGIIVSLVSYYVI